MSAAKKMEQSAKAQRPGRKKKTRFVDAEIKSNVRQMLAAQGTLSFTMKTKIVKPALELAGRYVARRARAIVRAQGPRGSYGSAPAGDSKRTRTREKWTVNTAADRASGKHDDLSKSIKVKPLKTIRRVKAPTVVIVGPEHKMFGFGHMLEFGRGGYKKPDAHYLWSKEKNPELNDIDKIKSRPFLEPAGKQTKKVQMRLIEAYVKKHWRQF